MPDILDIDIVQQILTSGDFNQFIGRVETHQFECKAAPYQLSNDANRLEFAKDISALANGHGGWILIGLTTRRDPTHHGDIVASLGLFPQELLDPQTYLNISTSWVYPSIQGLAIDWFPSVQDSTRGLVGILVPMQSSSEKPYLVHKSLLDSANDTWTGRLFGYFERKQAISPHKSVQEIHSLIRDGHRFDSIYDKLEAILERQSSASSRVSEVVEAVPLSPKIQLSEIVGGRIDSSLEVAGLLEQASFALLAHPIQETSIPTLFSSRDVPVVGAIWHPPSIRHHGFDLDTLEFPNIVRGELRRSASAGGRKLLELWQDGTLIFTSAGIDFLCWGKQPIQENLMIINQIALVEVTYLFAVLYGSILESMDPVPNQISLGVALHSGQDERLTYALHPGPMSDWRFLRDVKTAPSRSESLNITVDVEGYSAGRASFELLAAIYTWFGFEENLIPYVSGENDERIISEYLISSI
ncbi:helix-turn-helix domain-containing protein [Gemmatimonadota bacterium]